MRNIRLTHFSNILVRNKEINILIPDKVDDNTKVLLLLHGYCGDHNDWITLGNAYILAEKYNMIFVMPSAENSYYINVNNGDRYYDYINTEVYELVNSLFRLNNEWYVAGLSMGGYGALLLGLKNDKYKKIGAFSAPCDLLSRIKINPHHNFECIFNNLNEKEVDLYQYIEKANKYIYLYCGTNDQFYDDNLVFYNKLKALKKNVTLESDSRGHVWELWRYALEKFLENVK